MIESTYQALKQDTRFNTYKLDEIPDHWHYKKSDDLLDIITKKSHPYKR